MKTTSKKIMLWCLGVVFICGMITGCGNSAGKNEASQQNYASDTGSDSYEMDSVEQEYADGGISSVTMDTKVVDETAANIGTASNQKTDLQKIIKTYDYNYETEHFDKAVAYLKTQITAYDGYISSSEMNASNYDSGYRTLCMAARIPAEKSDEFVSNIGEIGTVLRQSESAEDITLQYSDTESRIESLKIEQERLQELLQQAENIDTIVQLEERLTEVRYELEGYQTRKKLYDNRISYSTVNIILEEVSYTMETDDSTFVSRIVTGLKRSCRDIGYNITGLIEWTIIHLPYFLVWGIIIVIIAKRVRKTIKKRREKKSEQQKQSM